MCCSDQIWYLTTEKLLFYHRTFNLQNGAIGIRVGNHGYGFHKLPIAGTILGC
jgi:hypothetical protein